MKVDNGPHPICKKHVEPLHRLNNIDKKTTVLQGPDFKT